MVYQSEAGCERLGTAKGTWHWRCRTSWLVLHKLRRAMISPGRNLQRLAAQVVTSCFERLSRWYKMATTRPGKREADALPRVHRVASLFKRWVLGTYQGSIDSKHLQQYLDEFVFRFNRRTSGSRGIPRQRRSCESGKSHSGGQSAEIRSIFKTEITDN